MSEPPGRGTLARMEDAARHALEIDSDIPDPVVLRLLLRSYISGCSSGDAALLETALGAAVERELRETAVRDRSEWLEVFAEAVAITDDARVEVAIARLVELLGSAAVERDVETASGVLEALLRAAAAVGDRLQLSSAVDRLEALVGSVYRPGARLESAADHVALASALLTGFDITARLPYAMLGDELLQTARGAWWREEQAMFDAALDTNCRAAGAFRRMAALHRDADYIARAVVARGADYESDAARLVAALEPRLSPSDMRACARLGLALLDR